MKLVSTDKCAICFSLNQNDLSSGWVICTNLECEISMHAHCLEMKDGLDSYGLRVV